MNKTILLVLTLLIGATNIPGSAQDKENFKQVTIDNDEDIDIFGANHGSQGPPTVELWENLSNPE